ncbi:MAG: chloride channel protein [Acidobacteriota bacterium]|jgi:chloride channel protein, CIC family
MPTTPGSDRHHRNHVFHLKRLWIRALSLSGSPLTAHHVIKAREELLLRWVGFSLAIGTVTGLGVAAFDYLLRAKVVRALYGLGNAWFYLVLPALGLVAAYASVRWLVPSREGSLTEDYVMVFHDRRKHMRLGNLPGKMLASFLTLASGGSMGLEGPSIYMGATMGDWLQTKFKKLFRREDLKLLLVAGGAAGMAAIFKAPLTGLVFAMEAPYKDSLAARALIPALIASASSYITFVIIAGSEPIFAQQGGPHKFSVMDIIFAVMLGVCCGVGARLFVWFTRFAEKLLHGISPLGRAILGGLIVGILGATVFYVFHEPFIYGPGYMLLKHVLNSHEPFWMLAFLFGAKMAATSFTVAGGGVGGLFFPQAVLGAVMGAGFAHLIPGADGALYPLIGLAAFVGAGYRTPLAAISFVAETTGNPWALIPAMMASVVSFLIMGQKGISDKQIDLSTGSFH